MSTYLQYNNHMILHSTDPSKYFGFVADPRPILGVKYLTYFNNPTSAHSNSFYEWIDNPVYCKSGIYRLADPTTFTDYLHYNGSVFVNITGSSVTDMPGVYSGKTGLKNRVEWSYRTVQIKNITRTTNWWGGHFSSWDTSTGNDFTASPVGFKSYSFKFKFDYAYPYASTDPSYTLGYIAITIQSKASEDTDPTLSYLSHYYLRAFTHTTNKLSLRLQCQDFNASGVSVTVEPSVYNGASYVSGTQNVTLPTLDINSWHQMTIVRDSHNLYFYIDGTLYVKCNIFTKNMAGYAYWAGADYFDLYGNQSRNTSVYMTEYLLSDQDMRDPNDSNHCLFWNGSDDVIFNEET